MLKLNVRNNALCAAGAKVLAETLMGNQVLTEINIANNFLGQKTASIFGDTDMSGVAALADAIPSMEVLAKLDISKNDLRAKGGRALRGSEPQRQSSNDGAQYRRQQPHFE
jgi:hypothetical protein